MTLPIVVVLLVLFNIACCYFTFKTLEFVHALRVCKENNPSGGYYQSWSMCERLAGFYLESRCVININKLPQGGYNVYPYKWDRFRR